MLITKSSCFPHLDHRRCTFFNFNCCIKCWLKFHLLYRHCSPFLSMLFAAQFDQLCNLLTHTIKKCSFLEWLLLFNCLVSVFYVPKNTIHSSIINIHKNPKRSWTFGFGQIKTMIFSFTLQPYLAVNSSEDNWSVVLILNQRANIQLWLPLWSFSYCIWAAKITLILSFL